MSPEGCALASLLPLFPEWKSLFKRYIQFERGLSHRLAFAPHSSPGCKKRIAHRCVQPWGSEVVSTLSGGSDFFGLCSPLGRNCCKVIKCSNC